MKLRHVITGLSVLAAGAGGWAVLQARLQPPESCIAAGDTPKDQMVWVPGGRFRMGSEDFRAEEAPIREVSVEGFWISKHDVTNAQFARFVRETGYVTTAERKGGAYVFIAPDDVQDLKHVEQWWHLVAKADWRHPQGPDSDLDGRMNHPVVQVSIQDAQAYAHWAGLDLPSEAQWEFAARGGVQDAIYAWGSEPDTPEQPKGNFWRGLFPIVNQGSRGFKGTSPVGCFPSNGYGLFDMAGNVWQWTRDQWGNGAYVIKGGSFLCATNYCLRYRPAARQPGEPDSASVHIGFRTVATTPHP